jgi:hypothetical protein
MLLLYYHNYIMIIRTTIARTLRFLTTIRNAPFAESKSLKYQEKPWSREVWVTLSSKGTIKDAMHSGWMMSKEVLPFSYDNYESICAKAVECQHELTKEDILMLIELGVKYRVRL